MTRRAAATLILALAAAPAAARDPVLRFPVDCTLGTTCFIQNYMDRDGGPGVADHTCGPLTYDGHTGTDIALHDLAALGRDVTVRAVAPGTVLRLRNGVADLGDPTPGDQDCGNGVVVDHGGGWESQYCHLKQGSIAVVPGQRVNARTVLGAIGLSGRTEFPHLHLTLREDGRPVDPFHPADPVACDNGAPRQLWQDPIAYRPGGMIGVGLSDTGLDYSAIKAGTAAIATLDPLAPVLLVWAHMFGVQTGDSVAFRLTAPDGTVLLEQVNDILRTQARRAEAAGMGRADAPWPPGTYTAIARLIRDGAEIGTGTATLTVPRSP